MKTICPFCKQEYDVPKDYLNKEVSCTECHQNFSVQKEFDELEKAGMLFMRKKRRKKLLLKGFLLLMIFVITAGTWKTVKTVNQIKAEKAERQRGLEIKEKKLQAVNRLRELLIWVEDNRLGTNATEAERRATITEFIKKFNPIASELGVFYIDADTAGFMEKHVYLGLDAYDVLNRLETEGTSMFKRLQRVIEIQERLIEIEEEEDNEASMQK